MLIALSKKLRKGLAGDNCIAKDHRVSIKVRVDARKQKLHWRKKKMETEKMMFTVINDEGKEVECEVLFTFESEETGKNYIVYTDNTLDEEENTKVFASVYEPDMDETKLLPIETEKEWEIIEAILEELQEAYE